MAPGLLVNETPVPNAASLKRPHNNDAPRDIFPDGIRTSGQLDPIYERLQPYESFPKEITGPTAWRREDYIDHPERWTHRFTEEEAAEIGEAADKFIASGTPLTGISQVPNQNSAFDFRADEIL